MSNKSLSWKTTPLLKRSKNVGWSEDAYLKNGDKVYTLYYDNDLNSIFVHDLRNDVKYNISMGGKAKGYILSFKLNCIH